MADWSKITGRGNVQDRRGMRPAAIGGVGGLGALGLVFYLITAFFGGDPTGGQLDDVLGQLQQSQGVQQQVDQGEFEGADSYETFASRVLASNNEVWSEVFRQSGQSYAPPRLVLFRQATQSACGGARSEVGPHYCPLDSTVYLDETFFAELQRRFGAQGGDVAEAYVIAHEVGHHVQNELGIMERVRRAQQENPDSANELSILQELQADCFAGIWAHSLRGEGVFEPGEIREAIDAAEAVGDDRIQRSVRGQVNPETWTHGSSAQRKEWFTRGYESGRPSSCNTFAR